MKNELMNITDEIRKTLINEKEEKYKNFVSKLIPNINNILGIRLPILRKLAKKIIKNNWKLYLNHKSIYFEEIMLKAIIIGYINDSPENIISYIKYFIPEINNWSVCDSFCSGLKFANKNQEIVWEFITKYLNSKKEYEIRFAIVMMLNYYINPEYINKIFIKIDTIKSEKYYVQMAVAWLISICYIKYPQETMIFLNNTNIENNIFNKSIQKIIESKQVTNDTKNKIKSLKRANK